MKSLSFLLCLALAFVFTLPSLRAQEAEADSTGLPGDNFSLHGALEMFKKASSPEEFEKLLNTQDNNVNNLDLNGDGETDYVRVISKKESDTHVFILQVPVSATENQDIAVIELEKNGTDNALVQIVGDEEMYGEETIVEPFEEGDESEGGGKRKGPSFETSFLGVPRIVVNVWYWPCVRFVYAPAYVVWVSPWAWHRYPAWWRPWRPVRWAVFHPLRTRYHVHYAIAPTHRVVRAHRVYTPHRSVSVTVRTRHAAASRNYRVTRTTTIRKGPAGVGIKTQKTTIRKRR